ncbi:2-polyprenyl-6-methoxyphenol hydroxylase-like FAD-dependent oxidoreductase [Prosthecobacter fusiformis]|uniref:2-polyprenyl-6-methoxyphenol hydroxylase-like FAD-dependent oxidoreductase n=2 Tax=Prosthecobacter fusiformis TaxID=48464 RepID=A0A4R7RLL4_9BACT|nr:2-polyprenyl-6-methoxyphenol hydroxylase-like FAD-dependent oxidoreductase [Prosthecobacter fusiformis]
MMYTPAQRWVALAYGLVSHTLFLAAVGVMFVSLYEGLHLSLLHLHGWAAAVGDVILVLQFGLGHSLLLSDQGRRWLARMAPLGLGRELSTTVFAGLASLQLLITFLLWSSSKVLWAAPEGWVKGGLSVLYGISWLLLAKSMSDAGLDVQVGSIGWHSVWRGHAPVFRPFARTGLFRYSRQPIYSSFTLILWTAPVWTPDHLLIAMLWTLYCVGAPVWKEKRYLRFYGQAYARYQAVVPYWFPGRKGRDMSFPTEPSIPAVHDAEVIVIGGGPVGMALACLLGGRGVRVLVVEKRGALPSHSQAIGITPPTLAILSELGLDEAFIGQGLPIHDCHVHGESGALGIASFRQIPGQYPFILSLPQQISMRLLADKLALYPSVKMLRGVEVVSVEQTGDAVTVGLKDEAGVITIRSAAYAVGCDGHRSRVRDLLRMRSRRYDYGHHFVMGDFQDRTALGGEAHLFFTAQGAVESFPLPGGLRRWIVQTKQPEAEPPAGFISEVVRMRSGHIIAPEDQVNQSAFSPWRLDCEQLYDGRVILCGDAAHVMSPIGGQGMNTGFADAEFAALMLHAILRQGQQAGPWLAEYDRCRRKASNTAATRAALGMGLGTWRGKGMSWLRDRLLRHLILRGPMAGIVGPWFAMMTIPFNRAAKSRFVATYMTGNCTEKSQPESRLAFQEESQG